METGKECVIIAAETTDCFYDLDDPNSGLVKKWIDTSLSQPNSTSTYPSDTLQKSYANAKFSTPFSSVEGMGPNFTVRTIFNIGSTTPLDGIEGALFLDDTYYESGVFIKSEHRCVPNFGVINVN